eukprot:scaffold388_cov380-Prasinococcus_capsulatus_cf.AAC.7
MNGTDWFGRSFERLAHIRQAITFLGTHGLALWGACPWLQYFRPYDAESYSRSCEREASEELARVHKWNRARHLPKSEPTASIPASLPVLAGIQGILRRQQHKLPEEERAKGLSYKLELESMPPGLDIVQIVHQGGARDGVTAIEAEACSDAIWGEIVVQAQ